MEKMHMESYGKKPMKTIGRSAEIDGRRRFDPAKRRMSWKKTPLRREMLVIYGDGVETYVTLRGRAEKRCCIDGLIFRGYGGMM